MTSNEKKRILAVILLFMFMIGGRQLTKMEMARKEAKGAAEGYPITRDTYLLDTYCSMAIYAGGGNEAMSAAVEALNKYDDLLNYSKESSDIYKINNRTMDKVEIDGDTARLLKLCREFCVLTDGVLEPAIKPVTSLWDFKDEKKLPEDSAIKEALTHVKSLKWDVSDNTFTASDPDVRIDVGAVAKGFIADRIKDVMVENGVTSGIINLGGNVLCIGARPDGEVFKVAVKDPKKSDGYFTIVDVVDESVVTAGAYERCFEENGVRYHHIIDPETGYSAQTGLESVTIVGKESAVCDALTTSIFIMGESDGSSFLEKYNSEHNTGYKVYFLKQENE